MNKYIIYTAMIISSLIIISCGPKNLNTVDETMKCNPHSLEIDSTAHKYIRIAWDPGCPGIRMFRGFNIYLSQSSLAEKYPGHDLPASIEPYNAEDYPGSPDGNGITEYYEFKNLSPGIGYYAHIRVVNGDGSFSLPSNEIEVVYMPQGEITLGISYSNNNDGYSFVEDSYCRTNDLQNDLYYYHKDGKDYLCSPSRISSVNRANEIYKAGSGSSLGDVDEIIPEGESYKKIEMKAGNIFIIVDEDGRLIRLRLIRMQGTGNERKAIFEYYYQMVATSGV